jgi:Co/Zn/Cd efflux system component
VNGVENWEGLVGNVITDMRTVVRLVALSNLAYFGVEFTVAVSIGSVSLFADSIDFLEDASVNFLILIAWDGARRIGREWARHSMGFSWFRASPRSGWHGISTHVRSLQHPSRFH